MQVSKKEKERERIKREKVERKKIRRAKETTRICGEYIYSREIHLTICQDDTNPHGSYQIPYENFAHINSYIHNIFTVEFNLRCNTISFFILFLKFL